jgi:putative transposase
MVSPAQRRAAVRWAQETYRLSARRACRVFGTSRRLIWYRSVRPVDAHIRRRLHELAAVRLTFGYKRLHVFLRREGLRINVKKVYRLYCEEGLQLKPRRRRRRKAATVRMPRATVTRPNERWAMDFMHDVLADGRSIRVFTLIDVFTRECIALEAAPQYKGTDVARILSETRTRRGGLPSIVQCDNGTEFTSTALDHWAYWNHVQLDFSRPGKPVDNAVCEAFNGSLRRECLSLHWFASIPEANDVLTYWKNDYNNTRPHKSLGTLSPADILAGGSHLPRRLNVRS